MFQAKKVFLVLVVFITFLGSSQNVRAQDVLETNELPADSPIIEIPLRIIHILDSEGNAELIGDTDKYTVLTFSLAQQQIDAVNEFYRPAKIKFTLKEEDFETRRDDYLNLDSDPPAGVMNLRNKNLKPTQLRARERIGAFQKLADERLDRITVLVHRGSEWRWNEKTQQWDFGVGDSHGGGGLKIGRGAYIRLCHARPSAWAHELAHSIALPHTFKDNMDKSFDLATAAGINAICQDYLNKGGDPEHPEYAMDGDITAGVDDTPPDPGNAFWGSSRELTNIIEIQLFDRQPLQVIVARNNLMSRGIRGGEGDGFSPGQIRMMRRRAQEWQANLIKN